MSNWLNTWGGFLTGLGTILVPLGTWYVNRKNQEHKTTELELKAQRDQQAQRDAMEKYFNEAIQKDNQGLRKQLEEIRQTADQMEARFKEQLRLKDQEIRHLRQKLNQAETLLRQHHISMEGTHEKT